MSRRKVSRVLVMVEYEPGNPDNGEVFDLTALLGELRSRAEYGSAHLSLEVRVENDYSQTPTVPKMELSWGGHLLGGEWVSGASHLEDVLNTALPDGERVKYLRKKAKGLRTKADQCDADAMRTKLEQVAAVRHLHPIARVTVQPGLLDAPASGEASK